jgi:hypothetical protein
MHLLLIIRTPEAVVSSIVRRGGLSPDNAIARWSQGITILDELEQTRQPRCLPLQFEELLQSPQTTLNAICDFLGLAFDPKMRDGHKHTKLYNQHSGIDTSKAKASTGHSLSTDLRHAEPDAFSSYERLCQRASDLLNECS